MHLINEIDCYFSSLKIIFDIDFLGAGLLFIFICLVPIETGTFQDQAARVFNNLPEDIRNCNNYNEYCRDCLAFFKLLAKDRLNNVK